MERLAESSSKRFFASPKRNPILQDNNEETMKLSSGYKRTAASNKVTINDDAKPLFTAKSRGKFNPKFEHPEERVKPKGIRTGIDPPLKKNKNDEDLFRRSKKSVDNPNWLKCNPIVEGDHRWVEHARCKSVEKNISFETQRLNDSRYVLPSDRTERRRKSPHSGRVFREQKFNIFVPHDPYWSAAKTPHPFETKIKFGTVKGVIQYESALPYRDYGITPNPTKNDPQRLRESKDEYRGMFVVRKLLTEYQ